MVGDFVQQLRLQQLRLKTDLRSKPASKAYADELPLKRNAARLEIMDRLSLHFSMNPEQGLQLEGVPVNDQGEETEIDLHPSGAGEVTIAPYPFRRDALSFSILARRVPKRIYSGEQDFQNTLAASRYFPVKFTLNAPRTQGISQAAFH